MIPKKIYLSILLLFCLMTAKAQNKIGDNPNTVTSSSVLELESTNKGFRLPRLVLTDLKVWSPLTGSATSGMVVYNEKNVLPEDLYYWRTDSMKWARAIDSLMVTKVVSKSMQPTGLISPTAYYQATSGSSTFPTTSVSYPGDGNISYAKNEAIRLIYNVKGIKAGYPVSATVSSTFNNNILIGRIKVVSDNTVEVFTYNCTTTPIIPSTLQMSFSYTYSN
jgi:hypothetical protein